MVNRKKMQTVSNNSLVVDMENLNILQKSTTYQLHIYRELG